jgi:hypothetical protein
MGNGNLRDPIERLCAGRDVLDGVNYLSTVISHAALITNTDRNSLEYDKAFLVLKSLLIDLFRPNSTLAMLAPVTV